MKRQEYIMQAQIALLPNMESEARKEFLNNLMGEQEATLSLNAETDFDAIKRAKQMLKTM
ncbi:hypothetical protein [Bacillus sp. SM2101]|uniref:hypothetical protein n=1 Tax=Bacillus sp. SM2101 TaxID=2805366 RepID=UPI001BDF2AA4|nr:hypothetical protein [Bacillus sp. SM2101]